MTVLDGLRLLKPVGWAVLAAAVLLALVVFGRGIGLHWDPFGTAERRLEQAERRATVAAAESQARALEAEAIARQARQLERHQQQAIDLARVTAVAEALARNAPDAQTPLDPPRADRIRAHDRELCRLTPSVCVTAAPDPAAGDPVALPAGSAARTGDPGRS